MDVSKSNLEKQIVISSESNNLLSRLNTSTKYAFPSPKQYWQLYGKECRNAIDSLEFMQTAFFVEPASNSQIAAVTRSPRGGTRNFFCWAV